MKYFLVFLVCHFLEVNTLTHIQRRTRVKNIGGAEYHVAVRPRQGGGCGKGDVLPPTQSTKKILLAYA